MTTRIMAVLNQKGGVGKTTTCVNLGAGLARRGQRVLLIDLDPQANLTVHMGLEPHRQGRNSYSLLLGEHGLSQAVRQSATPGLLVVPSTLALANAEIQLASTVGRELVLREAIEAWNSESGEPSESPPESPPGGERVDFILIDCPPSLGILTMNALCAASEVVLPIQTEFFALQGVAGILESLKAVQRLNRGLRLSMVVPCMVDRRTTLARDVLAEVRSYFADMVTQAEIRVNVKLAEAPSHGKTIFDYEPRCNGALDYAALAAEVLGVTDDEPIVTAAKAEAAEPRVDEAPTAPAAPVAPAPVAPLADVPAPRTSAPGPVVPAEPAPVLAPEPETDLAGEPKSGIRYPAAMEEQVAEAPVPVPAEAPVPRETPVSVDTPVHVDAPSDDAPSDDAPSDDALSDDAPAGVGEEFREPAEETPPAPEVRRFEAPVPVDAPVRGGESRRDGSRPVDDFRIERGMLPARKNPPAGETPPAGEASGAAPAPQTGSVAPERGGPDPAASRIPSNGDGALAPREPVWDADVPAPASDAARSESDLGISLPGSGSGAVYSSPLPPPARAPTGGAAPQAPSVLTIPPSATETPAPTEAPTARESDDDAQARGPGSPPPPRFIV